MHPLLRILRWLRPPRRLRLTREGRYFLAITVGIGLAAINTGNNLLYLLLGWLLSVIIASGVLSEMTLRGLEIRRRPPVHIHADQSFLMEISVDNIKGSLASYSIEVEDLVDEEPLNKKCYFLKVPPGRVQRTSYRHTFTRRGRYRFSGFRVSTKFPFGLFRKSRNVDGPGEVVVFPALYPVAVPPPRQQNMGSGEMLRLGRRGEFFGLREYRHGDDQRDIHWLSTARSGRPLVREYEEEAQKRVTIFMDNALPRSTREDKPRKPKPPKKPRKPESQTDRKAGDAQAHDQNRGTSQRAALEQALERAISRAASLTSAYIRRGYAVRLIARGCQVPYAAGPAQLTRILEALALLDTVTDEVRFSGTAEPRFESILVAPEGSGPMQGRPAGTSHTVHID